MSALLLVQIPHTAGTTFRLAACRHWGSNRILSDHGPGNRYNSPLVEELVHLEQDHHQFKEVLKQKNIALLTSSMPLNGLRRIFPASNLITFVSNPINRLIKVYQQLHTEKLTNASFIKFCQRAENQNVQTRYLKELPLELYGFIGLTERYSESLQLINAEFGCHLTELRAPNNASMSEVQPFSMLKRTGSSRKSGISTEPNLAITLSDKTINTVLALNTLDTQLYKNTNDLLDIRLHSFHAEVNYIHGKVNQLTQDKISGWAVSTRDHNPCKVRVLINEECVAITSAREYSSVLKERNVSRDGYVGFSFHFPEKLKPDDIVSCHIHPTDQLLGGPRKPLDK